MSKEANFFTMSKVFTVHSDHLQEKWFLASGVSTKLVKMNEMMCIDSIFLSVASMIAIAFTVVIGKLRSLKSKPRTGFHPVGFSSTVSPIMTDFYGIDLTFCR